MACATLAATASSALAGGGIVKYSYTANISPASAPAGQSTTFDVALANTSSPGVGLASAAITPPLGFRVTGASLPAGTSGHVYVLFNIVLLDRVNIGSGKTVHVSVRAIAPSRCKSPFNRWFTVAATGGFRPALLRLDEAHSGLTTPVTCATGSALAFDTQPDDALVSDVITGNPNDSSGPPITVDIVDSSGNTVDSSAPVTIALGNNPGGATLGGTLTRNAVHGVATFNDLTLDKPNNGYTLTASRLRAHELHVGFVQRKRHRDVVPDRHNVHEHDHQQQRLAPSRRRQRRHGRNADRVGRCRHADGRPR